MKGDLPGRAQGGCPPLGITLTVGAGFGNSVGINLSGSVTLDLNTSSQPVTFTEDGTVVQPGFLLTIAGSADFLGLATATGSVTISISNSAFMMSFNVNFTIAGAINIAASGFAGIYNDGSPGVVLQLSASINASIAGGIVKINAGGDLFLNTTAISRTANGNVLGPHSFKLSLNGSPLSLLDVFKIISQLHRGHRRPDGHGDGPRHDPAGHAQRGRLLHRLLGPDELLRTQGDSLRQRVRGLEEGTSTFI